MKAVDSLDPREGKWRKEPDMLSARGMCAATVLGGKVSTSKAPNSTLKALNSTLRATDFTFEAQNSTFEAQSSSAFEAPNGARSQT